MKKLLQLALAGVALVWAGTAAAQTTTLRIGNWLPGHHLIPRGIIEPWARAIERESNGSLKLELMPSAIGRPPEYFDFVVNGVVDIGYGVSGHNTGRFPMTQVMDLPFMSPDPWLVRRPPGPPMSAMALATTSIEASRCSACGSIPSPSSSCGPPRSPASTT